MFIPQFRHLHRDYVEDVPIERWNGRVTYVPVGWGGMGTHLLDDLDSDIDGIPSLGPMRTWRDDRSKGMTGHWDGNCRTCGKTNGVLPWPTVMGVITLEKLESTRNSSSSEYLDYCVHCHADAALLSGLPVSDTIARLGTTVLREGSRFEFPDEFMDPHPEQMMCQYYCYTLMEICVITDYIRSKDLSLSFDSLHSLSDSETDEAIRLFTRLRQLMNTRSQLIEDRFAGRA